MRAHRMRIFTLLWSFTLLLTVNAGFIQPGEEFLCPDGKQGIINYLQHFVEQPFQPAIFTLDCPWIYANTTHGIEQEKSTLLEKRQSSVCANDCTRAAACYGGTGTPSTSDCQALSGYLRSRNSQTTVAARQAISVSTGTSCLFRFTNNAASAVTWCDSNWASQSDALISRCLPQTPGGYCEITQFKLDVCLNPSYTPPQTYAVSTPAPQSSDSPSTNHNGATIQQVSSTAAESSSSTSSSGPTSSSTTHTGTSNTTSSPGSSQTSTHETAAGISGDVSIASASSESSRNNGGGDVDREVQRKGTSPAAIVGGVMGGIALFGLIAALIFWRKKMQERNRSTMKVYDDSYYDGGVPQRSPNRASVMTESRSQVFTISADHPPPPNNNGFGFGSSAKANMFYNVGRAARPAPPVSEYSTSSVNHLLGGANTGTGSLMESTASGMQPISDEPAHTHNQYGNGHGVGIGDPDLPTHAEIDAVLASHAENQRRRSISARTLAQAMAPNLSEDDIHRLADSIVSRMQARDTAAAFASAGGYNANGQMPTVGGHNSSTGYVPLQRGGVPNGDSVDLPSSNGYAASAYGGAEGTVYTEDPPPPWRASWRPVAS